MKKRIVRWALLGAAVGAVIGSFPLATLVLSYIYNGTRVDWAEILTYLVLGILLSAFSWSGLLGALAAAITGAVLFRLRPESSRIGLVAAASATLVAGAVVFIQFGPFSFHLVEVKAHAEPTDYTGPCPVSVKVIGSITRSEERRVGKECRL